MKIAPPHDYRNVAPQLSLKRPEIGGCNIG
jgi:hypothetical protein